MGIRFEFNSLTLISRSDQHFEMSNFDQNEKSQ